MTSKKISQLDTNGEIENTDVIPVATMDGTLTYRMSMDDLVEYMDDHGNYTPTIVEKIMVDYEMSSETRSTIFLIDAQNNNITFALDSHTQHVNQEFTFKRIDDQLFNEDEGTGHVVLILGSNGNTIDGEPQIKLNVKNESVSIVGSNHGWFII
jgi:hypothetical protein